ncbi:hypothetical protein HPB49_000477 [Dermacentor silvarum]|uniref:Uncharacterized protein n=1 Tax=Dermacentor silvarum TaxID=543639 RepID=A0ACB8CCK6_DERSI|nr:amine sulfotransferase [Dermacentor silvarum]KAH7940478.1 hypothetical protein HPB49_000477 [Dermacentor silvarum]
MNDESLIEVDGLLVNDFLREENVRAAMHYRPRDDDVFIASYPKCGTTWTQYIVCNIFTRGNAPNNVTDFLLQAPYFDFMGADAPRKMPRPGALMTHLPFNMRCHSNKANNCRQPPGVGQEHIADHPHRARQCSAPATNQQTATLKPQNCNDTQIGT